MIIGKRIKLQAHSLVVLSFENMMTSFKFLLHDYVREAVEKLKQTKDEGVSRLIH
jgi:hypothetical protein